MARKDEELERATYYLNPLLKNEIRALSVEYGVPQSQIVMLLLYSSIEELRNGKVPLDRFLVPSDSPKFRNNIDFDSFQEYMKKR
jgi:hypothetical protein